MPKVTATLVDSGTISERCDVMHFFLPTRRLLRINGVDNDRGRHLTFSWTLVQLTRHNSIGPVIAARSAVH